MHMYQQLHAATIIISITYLFPEFNDVIKVGMVDVSIYTEKSFQNCFRYRQEISGEWHSCVCMNEHNKLVMNNFSAHYGH